MECRQVPKGIAVTNARIATDMAYLNTNHGTYVNEISHTTAVRHFHVVDRLMIHCCTVVPVFSAVPVDVRQPTIPVL